MKKTFSVTVLRITTEQIKVVIEADSFSEADTKGIEKAKTSDGWEVSPYLKTSFRTSSTDLLCRRCKKSVPRGEFQHYDDDLGVWQCKEVEAPTPE